VAKVKFVQQKEISLTHRREKETISESGFEKHLMFPIQPVRLPRPARTACFRSSFSL